MFENATALNGARMANGARETQRFPIRLKRDNAHSVQDTSLMMQNIAIILIALVFHVISCDSIMYSGISFLKPLPLTFVTFYLIL